MENEWEAKFEAISLFKEAVDRGVLIISAPEHATNRIDDWMLVYVDEDRRAWFKNKKSGLYIAMRLRWNNAKHYQVPLSNATRPRPYTMKESGDGY